MVSFFYRNWCSESYCSVQAWKLFCSVQAFLHMENELHWSDNKWAAATQHINRSNNKRKKGAAHLQSPAEQMDLKSTFLEITNIDNRACIKNNMLKKLKLIIILNISVLDKIMLIMHQVLQFFNYILLNLHSSPCSIQKEQALLNELFNCCWTFNKKGAQASSLGNITFLQHFKDQEKASENWLLGC